MIPTPLASIKFANAVKCGPHIESEYLHAKNHDVTLELRGFWVKLQCNRTKEISWSSLFNTINITPTDLDLDLGDDWLNAMSGLKGKVPHETSKAKPKGKAQNDPSEAIEQAQRAAQVRL